MSRFFIPPQNINNRQAFIQGQDAHHLANVLRIKPGDVVEIGSMGRIYTAVVNVVMPGKIVLELQDELSKNMEPPLDVYLLLGLTKGDKMDLAIEKATELGVFAIVPVACRRSVVRLDAKQGAAKIERWQRVAETAAKQCRRAHIPQVLSLSTPEEAVALLPSSCRLLIPWEEEKSGSFKAALSGNHESIALMIGPEGGLEVSETEVLKSYGGMTVTMGPRILRAETAAIAALSIVMYACGDMGVAQNE